jgi:hypothetical protein
MRRAGYTPEDASNLTPSAPPDNEPPAMQDQPGDPRGELRDHERGEQVASLDRRIEALEKLYAKSTAEEHTAAERGRKELIHKAIHGALDAMAHIKRAPIDRPGRAL